MRFPLCDNIGEEKRLRLLIRLLSQESLQWGRMLQVMRKNLQNILGDKKMLLW